MNNAPSSQKAQDLLDKIAPGCALRAIHPLTGCYSNLTHLVEAEGSDGSLQRFVVRSYVFGQREVKARVEYTALRFLQNVDVPAPKSLYIDAEGAILGSPGIVMSYVPGKLLEEPSLHPSGKVAWAEEMAAVLARIHSVDCRSSRQLFLDANDEATWFLRGNVIPDYMLSFPDGERVWQTVEAHYQQIRPVAPTLVHIDFWRGNVLWEQDLISAVVDWEEAACGDPGIDVGYCLMDLVIMGMHEEAQVFLRKYASLRGPVPNLYFWTLAATARPMYDLDGWITDKGKAQRFRQFISSTIKRF
jgi:aminoglycoside phosphotransferase (APT) family kinase protein